MMYQAPKNLFPFEKLSHYDSNSNEILPLHQGPNQGLLYNMHYSMFNYRDFVYLQCTNSVDKTLKNRKAKTKLSDSVVRQRQLKRNKRERARQNRLNDAFDVLRSTIPEFLTPYKKGEKLTQIETLRLALYYISSLRDVLKGQDMNENADQDENNI